MLITVEYITRNGETVYCGKISGDRGSSWNFTIAKERAKWWHGRDRRKVETRMLNDMKEHHGYISKGRIIEKHIKPSNWFDYEMEILDLRNNKNILKGFCKKMNDIAIPETVYELREFGRITKNDELYYLKRYYEYLLERKSS